MKIRMQQSMAGKKGLTFGVTMTIGEYAVIPSLARFLKAHPQWEIHICYGNTQTLLSRLREGTLDFAKMCIRDRVHVLLFHLHKLHLR